jgi:hypothetical protein
MWTILWLCARVTRLNHGKYFLIGVHETARNSIQVFKDVLQLKEKLEREVLPHFSTR